MYLQNYPDLVVNFAFQHTLTRYFNYITQRNQIMIYFKTE